MSTSLTPQPIGAPVEQRLDEPGPRYAGLATRVISFVVDAAIINVVALVVGLGAALILSILHLPHKFNAALAVIGGAAYVLWLLGYFVAFWSTTGQSPGARLMQIRVVSAGGERIKPRRALVRYLGMVLAALPLFAGFASVLFDGKRRAFQDYVARTVVVIEEEQLSLAALRKTKAQAAARAARQQGLTRSR